MRRSGTRSRAASLVEYTLVIVAVLLIAAGSYKLLGGQLAKRSSGAGDVVSGETNGAGAGSKSGGGGGGKSGGGGGGDGTVAGKTSLSGAGGGNYESGGGGGRDTSADGTHGNANGGGGGGNANVDEGFNGKRWMGIGFLAAGVLALGYVLMTMRNARKMGNALGPSGKGGGGKPRAKSA